MNKSLILLACAWMIPAVVWGQATAQLHGVVQDMTGAAVPGAAVKATQTDTGIERVTTSGADGAFALTNLALGPYRVETTKPGFAASVRTGIVLQVDSDPTLTFSLGVGAVTESISVEANASQVETRAQGIGNVIESQRVLELPLNGRNVTDLVTVSGAAVQVATSPSYGMATGALISVAGGTAYSVQYLLDGAVHLDTYVGNGMPLPFPEALQEFKITTSAQDATSGGHSGATVSSVTRSGTNAIHGDAFEFLRNSALNGTDFFSTRKDQLKRNQFGGVIGGPIKKDKLFFFAGYQRTALRQTPSDTQAFVPTAAMLTGDFTAYVANGCGSVAGLVNGHLPSVDPIAVKLSSYLPAATNACGLVYTGLPVHQNLGQAIGRVDYQISDKQSFFARYINNTDQRADPHSLSPNDLLSSGPQNGAPTLTGTDDMFNSLVLGDTYIVNANLVNSFRVFGNRVGANHFPSTIPSGVSYKDLGINVNPSGLDNYFNFNVTGGFQIDNAANALTQDHEDNFGINNDVTWIHGKHQVAFGVSYFRGIVIEDSYAFAGGQFVFASLSDFLQGKAQQFKESPPNPNYSRQNFLGVYVADTWKLSQHLTVNAGVRWDPYLPLQLINHDGLQFSQINFNAGIRSTVLPSAPPGILLYGDQGYTGNSGIGTKLNHFSPRLGFAYDPFGDGKTAIRAGAGMAYDFVPQNIFQNVSSVSPYRLATTVTSVSLSNPWNNPTTNGVNPYPYSYLSGSTPWPSIPNQNLIVMKNNIATPLQYQWNFGIQRQITTGLFASATYIGSHMIHTWNGLELNPAVYIPGNCVAGQYGLTAAGPCSSTSNTAQRRLLRLANPSAPNVNTLGSIAEIDDSGTASYNGLLMNSTYRKGNVNIQGNYTWSHCLGLSTATFQSYQASYQHVPGQTSGPVDRNLDSGNCTAGTALSPSLVDYRQIANVTLVVKTPKFSNNWTRRIASGWTLASIVTARTGAHLTPNTGSDVALNGIFLGSGTFPVPQRPNIVLADTSATNQGQSCSPGPCVSWLNRAAFALPATGTLSSTGIGGIVGPGFWEWDQTISHQFRITESQQIEFRAEAFNVTNTERLGNPGVTYSTASTFGKITSSAVGSTPRVVQFALKYIF
ncbi:MAG: TonB-dependent receptor [Acidobacteriota bacterium]|nr:TonB-dependent receptor [Acidobacteriota bacterium]